MEEMEVGMPIELATPEGQVFPATILSINENDITVDLNHPLAGLTLNFKIKLEEIKN
jgi:FKBP-type peptidyl-prolyl cis-trans isomerase 2